MSKLSMLRKAAGLGAKEEETKDDQPVTEIQETPVEEVHEEVTPVEEIPVVNSEETPVNGTPVVETQPSEVHDGNGSDSQEPNEETPENEGAPDENESKDGEQDAEKPKPKRRSKRSSARDSNDSQDAPEDNPKKEKDQEDTEPKRGRKGVRRDRVIVMLDKETIEILDSFSISRSGTARAVILATQDFLANIEGDIKEDELVSKIKDKLS